VQPKELADALIEISQSCEWITVHGSDEKRLTFEDDRAWAFFSAALDPWNDFTYVWLRDILEPIADHLAEHATLDDFDLHEHVEASLDVYTSELVRWLATRANNIDYLTTALELAPKDGFQLLTMAQYEAIQECFQKVIDCAAALLD